MIHKLFRKRSKNKTTHSVVIGEKSIALPESEKVDNNYPRVTGDRSIVLGIDAKIIPVGKCKRGCVAKETKDYVTTPLNITKSIGKSCVYNFGGLCYFGGKCKDKIYYVKVKRVVK